MPVHSVESIVSVPSLPLLFCQRACTDPHLSAALCPQLISVISLLSQDIPNLDGPANVDAAVSPCSFVGALAALLTHSISVLFWSNRRRSERISPVRFANLSAGRITVSPLTPASPSTHARLSQATRRRSGDSCDAVPRRPTTRSACCALSLADAGGVGLVLA